MSTNTFRITVGHNVTDSDPHTSDYVLATAKRFFPAFTRAHAKGFTAQWGDEVSSVFTVVTGEPESEVVHKACALGFSLNQESIGVEVDCHTTWYDCDNDESVERKETTREQTSLASARARIAVRREESRQQGNYSAFCAYTAAIDIVDEVLS